MFELSDQPIHQERYRAALIQPEGGAFVEFVGTVRNVNHGRTVTALEYESAGTLAQKEFAKIEAEAHSAFSILRLSCVHRSGRVLPGEPTVWIGVTARHRDAAFSACRFAIDELKKRLPIWKKEYYSDGESDWINAP